MLLANDSFTPKTRFLYVWQSFRTAPQVYTTAIHTVTQNKYDAASVWVEDVNHVSFKLCLRELKNYDGEHEHVKVVSDQLFLSLNCRVNEFCSWKEWFQFDSVLSNELIIIWRNNNFLIIYICANHIMCYLKRCN